MSRLLMARIKGKLRVTAGPARQVGPSCGAGRRRRRGERRSRIDQVSISSLLFAGRWPGMLITGG
ncbi:hypothetical protein A5780_32915 [Nocardia sp. 852002-20019_SCH5090214]|nr:hypothetical protein A5780_32915 [Nocardia sp. 852002-20019_SCH5090214]OBA49513.1 hypothetical protein A5789_32045 [Nocardia sp. 852002-51101_SCH5132738]